MVNIGDMFWLARRAIPEMRMFYSILYLITGMIEIAMTTAMTVTEPFNVIVLMVHVLMFLAGSAMLSLSGSLRALSYGD